jgi:hypothetical protein
MEEKIPAGWEPMNIGAGGSFESNTRTIRWAVMDNKEQTINYTLKASSDLVANGSIMGLISFDGAAPLEIVGDRDLKGAPRLSWSIRDGQRVLNLEGSAPAAVYVLEISEDLTGWSTAASNVRFPYAVSGLSGKALFYRVKRE